MDAQGLFTATLLDASGPALASRAVSRLSEAGGRDAERVATWGFTRLVADAAQRLRVLAEALAVGRREVFDLDVDWMRATLAARVVEPALLSSVLRALEAELAESLAPEAGARAREWLAAARQRTDGEAPPEVAGPSRDPEVRRFLVALLEGNRRQAFDLALESLRRDDDIGRVHDTLLVPAQGDMGRLWQRGELGVAEEHIASRLVGEVLTLLRQRIPPNQGPLALVSCVPGNMHDIGAQMVADRLDLAGWRALCLGADVPAADLAQAVGQFAPTCVAISSGLGVHVRATARLIEALRSDPATRVPVIVGGRIFSAVDGLWRDVGADAFGADAASAVAAAERWRRDGA